MYPAYFALVQYPAAAHEGQYSLVSEHGLSKVVLMTGFDVVWGVVAPLPPPPPPGGVDGGAFPQKFT